MHSINIRYKFFIAAFVIVWIILLGRVYFLAVDNNDYFASLALKNVERTEILVPLRGRILDRNDEPLAINDLGFKISLKAHLKKRQLQEALSVLNHYFAVPVDEMEKIYRKENSFYNHNPIEIIQFIPYAKMEPLYPILLQKNNIEIYPATKRLYLYNSLAAHAIGYVGSAKIEDINNDETVKHTKIIGRNGIEASYNDYLQGTIGYKKTIVNAYNKEIKTLETKNATKQNNLKLTIDIRLQTILDELFKNINGAVVILNANNGEILAASSYPNYDLNSFIGGISYESWNNLVNSPYSPLLDKVTKGLYPPGSVVKMGMGLSFLNNDIIGKNTIIDTPEYIMVGNHKFRDWKRGGHGQSDLKKAIKESVDVYFYKLIQQTNIDVLADDLRRYGLGVKSGVDLANEFIGTVPSPAWKHKKYKEQWYLGDSVNMSVGQGSFLSTPLQIARYTALIATGVLVTPHFVRSLASSDGAPKDLDFKIEDVLTKKEKNALEIIRLGMYEVCNSKNGGTAYRTTRGSKVTLACKTGTAQVVSIPQEQIERINEDKMPYFQRSHGWMSAFLPYKSPQYAITILVEHGGSGSANGKLLVKIANALYDLGYVK